MDTYVYKIDENLYINLTNKCSNACTFCVRNEKASYYGNKLWLSKEPTVSDITALIPDPTRYKEIVFCGFGEPTERLETMLEIAIYLKSKNAVTRLNTNGQGCLINNKNIVPLLKGKIDKINISLNESNEIDYEKLCKSKFKNAFQSVIDFGKSCKDKDINAWFSVVDCIGEQKIIECKKIADGVGIPLRVRKMIYDS